MNEETIFEPTPIDKEKLLPIYEEALKGERKIDLSEISKEDWLQLRQIIGLGASDISSVLGLNRYKTAFQLWKEKVSDEIKPIANKFTRWGDLLEPLIIEEYERLTGNKIIKDHFMRIHPKHNFLYADLDGIDKENPHDPTLAIECKSTVSNVYNSWKNNPDDCPQGIPLEYYCQVMHQFACVPSLRRIDIAILILDQREVEIKPIERDEEYIEKQTEAVVKWHNAYVAVVVAPPMTAYEYEYAVPHLGSYVEASDEIADAVQQLRGKREIKKGIEKEIESLENKIKEHIGEHESLVYAGQQLASWKQHSREYIDSETMRSIEPETYERFKKKTTFRVLRIK